MVCNTCKGHCCKSFSVFTTANDAARISKAINVEPSYFMNPYPATLKTNFPAFRLGNDYYLLGLDTRNGSVKDCKFMIDLGNARRCGIYNHRPMACRTYPFVMSGLILDFVEEDICPKQWWPEDDAREEYLDNIKQLNNELKDYNRIVTMWNKNSGKNSGFVEFLEYILKEVSK